MSDTDVVQITVWAMRDYLAAKEERDQLRTALRELVETLPKCLHCDEIGVKQCYDFVVCLKDADAYTTSDVEYAEPLRKALALLKEKP